MSRSVKSCIAAMINVFDAAGKARMLAALDKRPTIYMLMAVEKFTESMGIIDQEVTAGVLQQGDADLMQQIFNGTES